MYVNTKRSAGEVLIGAHMLPHMVQQQQLQAAYLIFPYTIVGLSCTKNYRLTFSTVFLRRNRTTHSHACLIEELCNNNDNK